MSEQMDGNGEITDLSFYLKSVQSDNHSNKTSKKKGKKKKKKGSSGKNVKENTDGCAKPTLGKRAKKNSTDEDKIPRKQTHVREGNSSSSPDSENNSDEDEILDPTIDKVSSIPYSDEGTLISRPKTRVIPSGNELSPAGSVHLSDFEIQESNTNDSSEDYKLVEKKHKTNKESTIRDLASKMGETPRIVSLFVKGNEKPNPTSVMWEFHKALNRTNIKVLAGRGTISVEVNSIKEYEAISQIRSIDNCEVRAKPLNYLSETLEQVIITGVPSSVDNESIIRYSKCLSAHRVTKKVGSESIRTTAVILSYRKGEAPAEIRMLYLIFKTRPYVKSAVRCFNCNLYGHVAKHCLRNTKCAKCCESHDTRNCTARPQEAMKCASCNSIEHKTGDKACQYRVRANEINRSMANRGLTYAQAAKSLGTSAPSANTQNNSNPSSRIITEPTKPTTRQSQDTPDKSENPGTSHHDPEEPPRRTSAILDKLSNRLDQLETNLKINTRLINNNTNNNINDYRNTLSDIVAQIVKMIDNVRSMTSMAETKYEYRAQYDLLTNELKKNTQELQEKIKSGIPTKSSPPEEDKDENTDEEEDGDSEQEAVEETDEEPPIPPPATQRHETHQKLKECQNLVFEYVRALQAGGI